MNRRGKETISYSKTLRQKREANCFIINQNKIAVIEKALWVTPLFQGSVS